MKDTIKLLPPPEVYFWPEYLWQKFIAATRRYDPDAPEAERQIALAEIGAVMREAQATPVSFEIDGNVFYARLRAFGFCSAGQPFRAGSEPGESRRMH
jgi:hypothetical protein